MRTENRCFDAFLVTRDMAYVNDAVENRQQLVSKTINRV